MELKEGRAELNLTNPKTDEDFFAIGRFILSRSTCLKTQTAALIVSEGRVISWGVNMCCPQGQVYGLPVTECPRMKKETGTYYELCKPIHAEIVAAINAFGISHIDRKSLWHFPGFTIKLADYQGFFNVNKNSLLYLLGHYWACTECVDFLKLIGIMEIKFDDLSGGDTFRAYNANNLTGKNEGVDASGCIVGGIVSVKIYPPKVNDFCVRNDVKKEDVTISPSEDISGDPQELDRPFLYLIKVPSGSEISKAKLWNKDSAVHGAEILLRKSA